MSTANLVSLSNKQLPFPMRQQVWICLTLVLLKLAERTFSHSLNICTYTPSRLCQKAGDTTTCICKVHLQLYIITPGEICYYPVIQFIQSRSILSMFLFLFNHASNISSRPSSSWAFVIYMHFVSCGSLWNEGGRKLTFTMLIQQNMSTI